MARIGRRPLARTCAATWPGPRPLTLLSVRVEGFDEGPGLVRVHVATAASHRARIDVVRGVVLGQVDGRGIVSTAVLTRYALLRVLEGGCVPRGKRGAIGSASEDGNRAEEESHRTHLQRKPRSRQPSGDSRRLLVTEKCGPRRGRKSPTKDAAGATPTPKRADAALRAAETAAVHRTAGVRRS